MTAVFRRNLPRVGAVFPLALATSLSAQTAPATDSAASSKAAATDNEIVILNPFVVSAAEDTGYRATSTLAGSRIRTDLKDVGSAISVVTEEFLRDTGSRKAEDLLVYTTNSEVAGQGGSFLGAGDGAFIDSTSRYSSPLANTRIRGLSEADNTRDYFLSDIPWDSYNTSRIDIQRGPNAVLFGIGSPAGIINASLDMASFADKNKVEFQFGSFGSWRISGNFNKVLLEDELALRVALLNDETDYKQEPAYKNDRRAYAAMRWDPKFFRTESARTSIRANVEKGRVRSNEPRLTPPMDAITPFWETGANNFNQRLFDARVMSHQASSDGWANLDEGVNFNGSPNYIHQMGSPANRVYDGVLIPFGVDGTQLSATMAQQPQNWPDAKGTALDYRRVAGIITYDKMMAGLGAPYGGIYKARSLTDPSIFDFYNNLLEGENKREWNDFTSFNFTISQTFMHDRLGFEFAYDQQRAEWGRQNLLSDDGGVITIDVVGTLTDGTPNPNAGRAVAIGGGGQSGGFNTERTRKSWRLTSFGKLDFKDLIQNNDTAAKILGHHTFTGMVSSQESRRDYQRWSSAYIDTGFGPTDAANANIGGAQRDAATYNYLDTRDLSKVSSPAGLNLGRVSYRSEPQSTKVNVWDNTTQAFRAVDLPIANPGNMDESERSYLNGQKNRRVTDSLALVWQGYMLDECIVPMVGYRRDSDFAYDAGAPFNTRGLAHLDDPNWRVPDGSGDTSEVVGGKTYTRSYNTEAGQSMTYSIVAHTPKALNKALPWGLKASVFYSQSENFRPDSSLKDIMGSPVDSPRGETKDYGFTISALDDKLVFKINWYKTKMTNAVLSETNLANAYMIGAAEAWGQRSAIQTRDGTGMYTTVYGIASDGGVLRWQPAGNGTVGARDGSLGSYSQAEIDARYAVQKASLDAWFANPTPAAMQAAWGMNDYASGGGSRTDANVAVTGNTESEGCEMELTARPITGLDISVNVAKTKAKRLDLAASYVSWVEERWKYYQGPAGDMLFWGGGNWALPANSSGTVRSKFGMEFMPNYYTSLALSGAQVSELRPWRVNVVANYRFAKDTFLKGFNVGAGYRWQDKQTIGYPVVNPDAATTGYYNQTASDLRNSDEYVDIANPFKGPSEESIDLWIGYERKLTDRIDWRIQLNVRNAFGSKDLIPVTWNPDNTPGTYRIPEPTTWSLTNTFTF